MKNKDLNNNHNNIEIVVTGVEWSKLKEFLKNKKFHTYIAEKIFKNNRYWKDRNTLNDNVKNYAALTGFTTCTKDNNTIVCNRFGEKRVRGKKRDLLSGSLQCNCPWQLKLLSSVKKIITSQSKSNKKLRKIDDFATNNPVIVTKNSIFYHKEPCNPSSIQQMYTNRTAGNYVSNISDHATFTLVGLLKQNPNLHTSTIKSILKTNFPENHFITNSDIFNTKVRCFRLMKIYNESNEDYNNFIIKLKNKKLYQGSMDFNSIPEDEAAHFSRIIWEDLLQKISENEINDDFESLKYFSKELSEKCEGFSYRFAYGNNKKANGLVWMTGSMRDNFKRFGSFISLDAMKRATNTFLWPYFSVVMINELNKNCVASEGIIISERVDAYKFLVQSTIDMGQNIRNKEDIYCVSGDGFFDDNSLKQWGLSNAKFITDHWHLFESSSLSKSFGEYYYNIIQGDLRQMSYSNTEDMFKKYYASAKKKLKDISKNNKLIIDKLDEFASRNGNYSKFKINYILGSLERMGSTPSEQNHSSVIVHLNNGDRTHKYVNQPHVLIKDLIERQNEHTKKFNKELANNTNLTYRKK